MQSSPARFGRSFSLSNKGWCENCSSVTCNLFQANKTVSSLLSVHARQMQQAKSPQRLPVPASLVVHLIAALQSSEWSTRRARIRDGSSTPVRCPERISVTSLRWKSSPLCRWKTVSLCFFNPSQPFCDVSALVVHFWNGTSENKLTTPHFLCRSGPTCTFPFVTMGNAV